MSERGIGRQHQSSVKVDGTIPTVSCNYAFMSGDGSPDTIPILVVRDCTTKAYAATAISKTGVDQYAHQFIVGLTREIEWIIHFSHGHRGANCPTRNRIGDDGIDGRAKKDREAMVGTSA